MEVHRSANGPHYHKVHHQNNLIHYLVIAAKPGEPSTFSPYLQSTYLFAVHYAFAYPLYKQQTKSE